MIISTEELVRWLSRLPQDRPFCTHDHCPVMEYLWREHMTLISPMEALKANRFVAVAADSVPRWSGVGSKRWNELTPRDLLDAMSNKELRHLCERWLRMASEIPRLPAPRSSCITTP